MLKGSMVALVTPMKADQSIDFETLKVLIDWQITEGTKAVLVLGTTGESPTVTLDERQKVIETTVERVANRAPVIVGTGGNSTKSCIELTQQAKKLGADAALLVSPYYNKPTQAGLFAHYQAIADAVEMPQILYNVPSRTASMIEVDTVAKLADHPNIVGIKDVSDSITRLNDLLMVCKGKMALLTGDDSNAFGFLLQGGQGVISVTANVVPKKMSTFVDALLAGNLEEAQVLHQQLLPLHHAMFVETNPAPVKWLLKYMGKIDSGIRLPLLALSNEYHELIRTTFERLPV